MISLIVAMDENNVIGKDNDLPWHIPEDLKLFKRHTTDKSIVMGRNTYVSLNRPKGLPKRYNIVVSKTYKENPPVVSDSIKFVDNLEDVMSLGKIDDEVFVIGGSQIYEASLPHADYLYISHIKNSTEGDVYFPVVNWDEWKLIETEEYNEFTFNKYKRKA